jgi:hypothetical protein
MSAELPAGALLKVTLEVRLPIAADETIVEKWLRFCLTHSGSFPVKHPLIDYEPEIFGTLGFDWEWRGEVGHTERTLLEERPDGTKRYSVRTIRSRP